VTYLARVSGTEHGLGEQGVCVVNRGVLSSERLLLGVIAGGLSSAIWIFASSVLCFWIPLAPVPSLLGSLGIVPGLSTNSESIAAVAFVGFVAGLYSTERWRRVH
jgi:hypothetical protein